MGPDDINALLARRFPAEFAEERLEQARAAVGAAGGDRAKRAEALLALGAALMAECRHGPRQPEMDEGIDALREVIALTPRGRVARTLAEQLLVTMLCTRRNPGDAAAAIAVAETLLSQVKHFSPPNLMFVVNLGTALYAHYVDYGGQNEVNRAVEVLQHAHDRMGSPRTTMARVAAGMVSLALAMCMATRFQHSIKEDPANIQRLQDLLAEIDVDLIAKFVPDAGQFIEMMRTGLPTTLELVGGGDPRRAAADGALSISPTEPGRPMSQRMTELASTMKGVARTVSFGLDGNLELLDDAIARQRADLAATPAAGQLRVITLVSLAAGLHTRYRTRRLAELHDARRDLDEAIQLAEEALTDPLLGPGQEAWVIKGRCLLDRYQEGLGTAADLDDAVRLLERAVYSVERDSRDALANRVAHSEALMVRAYRDSSIDDLDAAADTLEVFKRSLAPDSSFHAVVDVRIAAVFQHRAAALQETEHLLLASMRSRAAMESAAQVSVTWAYDAAWGWANWAWHHAPAAERAEAHLRAMTCLYRLARAQLTRESAEVALRRQTRNLTARSVRAAIAADRPADAVVAAETGRAVLLTLALQRQESALSTVVDPVLRERFRRARGRLAEAEAMAGSVGGMGDE
ncbi:tetratricopeptide (TPR) repeat protein [Kibdelosporangium banguiense]|uniref:Tetratricopeptide (TPR) repeat protein n=1 Tax=Kibdelosporangium banguiense TaxID=1365924 RepID=A0ABS4TUB8_9PSEU|nr:hypothetical protein [Kibdelosporangium banguiense]MBP2328009.1 tetratricopeptide (TPR) repeat protein [Kibdelosporangium banguiense]